MHCNSWSNGCALNFKINFICSMEGGATPRRDIGKALTGEDK